MWNVRERPGVPKGVATLPFGYSGIGNTALQVIWHSWRAAKAIKYVFCTCTANILCDDKSYDQLKSSMI